jgi:hypothetical protein
MTEFRAAEISLPWRMMDLSQHRAVARKHVNQANYELEPLGMSDSAIGLCRFTKREVTAVPSKAR